MIKFGEKRRRHAKSVRRGKMAGIRLIEAKLASSKRRKKGCLPKNFESCFTVDGQW